MLQVVGLGAYLECATQVREGQSTFSTAAELLSYDNGLGAGVFTSLVTILIDIRAPSQAIH